MNEFMKQPQECIRLDVGRFTALRTRQNSDFNEPFTPRDILSMTENHEVLSAFIADMMATTPTTGFVVEIQGHVISHPVTWQGEVKIKELFSLPRSGGYGNLIGIEGEFIAREGSRIMNFRTCLDLGQSSRRWSLPYFYLLEQPN